MYLVDLNIHYFYFNFFFLKSKKILFLNNFFFIIFFFNIFYNFIKFFITVRNFFIYINLNNSKLLIFLLIRLQINMYLKVNYLASAFIYYKFFFKIGLGFRKKYYGTRKVFIIYAGGRH
jgi:hypothetical protein